MRSHTFLLLSIALLITAVAGAQTKISGTGQCGKPDAQHMLEVGDRPNHSYAISQGKCTWSKPYEMEGIQAKDYVSTVFSEVTGNRASDRGTVVVNMANGDKAFVRFQGSSTMKEGAPVTQEGKWSYTGGTGKFKGLKGQGTYKGSADGTTIEVEGEYQIGAAKK